jgi:hypothetical protein
VSVPIQSRQTLAQLTPVTFASWALSGFYFSLMPALVRLATGAMLPIVGGLVVAPLTFSSVIAVLSLRNILANRVLLGAIHALALGVVITLGGVHIQSVALMLLGTMVSGLGFGAVLSGTTNSNRRRNALGAMLRAGAYSCESYQVLSCAIFGNSMTFTRSPDVRPIHSTMADGDDL